MDPYTVLANQIVLQAVKDYRTALRQLARTPRYKDSIQVKEECESFFLSEWFCYLTRVDGPTLMHQLRKEVV